MKRRRCIRVCLIILIYQLSSATPSAVTFRLNGGRLGDNLSNYWRAQRFAQLHNMPLLCPQFPYSNKLVLGHVEKKYTSQSSRQFQKIVKLRNDNFRRISNNSGTLYVIDFYYQSKHGHGYDDPNLRKKMRQLIKPVVPVTLTKTPKGKITIALHVRRGSGPDGSLIQSQKHWPTKFPPDSYYLEALRKISEIFNHQPLHAHIFTDSAYAEPIIKEFSSALDLANISFSCRKLNQKASTYHVLDDLFSMATFDCLIRTSSGLSRIAELIGKHKVVISPQNPQWINGKLRMQNLGIKKSLASATPPKP